MYFDNCTTADEMKRLHRRLSFTLHPDKNGGDDKAFKEMQAEYEQRLKKLIVDSDHNSTNSEEIEALIKLLLGWVKEYEPQLFKPLYDAANSPITKTLLSFGVVKSEMLMKIIKLI